MISQNDAVSFLKSLDDGSVDLVITDPPYDIENVKAGESSFLKKRLDKSQGELVDVGIDKCSGVEWCDEVKRIQNGKINCYIFCNKKQITMYMNQFVTVLKCSFDFIIWHKPNTPPTFYNKWMSDKEYCLYFRKGGWCMPENYQDASTVFNHPVTKKEKKLYVHPTVKPLGLIRRFVRNSSKPGQMIVDPFVGSGTTAVAAIREGREFLGCDINRCFVAVAQARAIDSIVNNH